jgi:hypothetical protein
MPPDEDLARPRQSTGSARETSGSARKKAGGGGLASTPNPMFVELMTDADRLSGDSGGGGSEASGNCGKEFELQFNQKIVEVAHAFFGLQFQVKTSLDMLALLQNHDMSGHTHILELIDDAIAMTQLR